MVQVLKRRASRSSEERPASTSPSYSKTEAASLGLARVPKAIVRRRPKGRQAVRPVPQIVPMSLMIPSMRTLSCLEVESGVIGVPAADPYHVFSSRVSQPLDEPSLQVDGLFR